MDPATWGPYVWKGLHAIAAQCDIANDGEGFWNYLTNLANVLPCETCKKHMQSYIASNPKPASQFFEYTVAFHNNVNARLGKKLINAEEARQEWASACTTTCSSEENRYGVVILYLTIMLSTLLIFFVLKRNLK
jgi:hypothetical protein